ncbi:NAD(P)-dependent oxidoreductase [Mycobacterium sp. AZCC_0083]|uniref:NAD(P)-dependent oxidoreductase n=1 Tax=Mycobacterium sp. AZCC_0083 TaxID=2735882 RepID=UPI001609763B|nr:NAD(P)-dependent oxidoreductase [Mycobacterium sp. AZCC_0083]MBB5166306.1 3-hydroxyisobutyrate dehydrogenase-like beta-hydroxyacid dehydrogenase [Mycobacterium sp. AZCC_0083]
MKVSVLGLGQMGSAIAGRLVDAGHTVGVWNRTKGRAAELTGRGAVEFDAPQDAWTSEVCITMLADSAALTGLILAPCGLVENSSARGKFLIDMSTVSPESSSEVARVATSRGIRYLRAPVSGNPGVVRAGDLTVVVSGAADDYAAMEALLRDIGPHVHYAGAGEAARIVKLGLNLMVAGTAELLAESVALAEAHGVDRSSFLEIVAASAVGSPLVKYKVGPLLADDYTSTFSTRLMRKDVDLILATAAAGGVPLPVTGLVQQLLQACVSTGLGDLDFTSLLIRLQREAGQKTD